MAETALAIVGVALAWKGIVDFGNVISSLMDDDSRQRDILVMKLETAEYNLRDWGEHWGPDREHGRFHAFETTRKELIMKIIFQLRDSRVQASKKLRKVYGVDDEDVVEKDPGGRLSRTMQRLADATKKGRKRTRWQAFDRSLITGLVDETMELHGCLNSLTSLSIKFLAANVTTLQGASSLESGLASLEIEAKNESRQRSIPSSPISMDQQTLAGYTTKSIPSSEQAERVQKHIDSAFHHHGDMRISESITSWWNNPSISMLVLEVPDDVEDRTSTSACVLLYHMVEHHKLIHIFEPQYDINAGRDVVDMLRSFIQSLVLSSGDEPFDSIVLPSEINKMGDTQPEIATLSQMVELFRDLLRESLRRCDEPILLVVDGLELIEMGKRTSLISVLQSFVKGLDTVCESESFKINAKLKVLLTYRGHANTLYDCLKNATVVDVTDRAISKASMFGEIAMAIRY